MLPPRYYMLFLLNAQGVPSVASWVRVDPAATAPVYAADAPAGGAAAGGGAPAGAAGAATAASVAKPSGASAKKAPAVKVSLAKVKLIRRGALLVATFTLRGKTAFTAKVRLGRLGAKAHLLPPVASRTLKAATAKKAKSVPVTLSLKAPKVKGTLKLGLQVQPWRPRAPGPPPSAGPWPLRPPLPPVVSAP